MTLQKLVHVRNAANGSVHANYAKSWVWRGGLFLVVVGSLADLFALSFAPQSLVTPLGSLTLVSNVIYAPLFLNERVDLFAIASTFVIIIGSVISVIYAPHQEADYTVEEIFGLFWGTGFMLFWTGVLGLLAIFLYIARKCELLEHIHGVESVLYRKYRPLHQFAYPSASGIVGAQSVLFAKCATSVVQKAGVGVLSYLGFYMVFIMTFVCIFSQIKLLNDGLKRFDVVYEVPIFQAFWILFSVLTGMALYKEHQVMTSDELGVFSIGVLITLTGVIMLSYRKPSATGTTPSGRIETHASEANELTDLPSIPMDEVRPRSRSRGNRNERGTLSHDVNLSMSPVTGANHHLPKAPPPLIPPPPHEVTGPGRTIRESQPSPPPPPPPPLGQSSADSGTSAVAYITSSIVSVARGLGLAPADPHAGLMGRELSVREALSMGIAIAPRTPEDSQWPSDIPRAEVPPHLVKAPASIQKENLSDDDAQANAADDERVESKRIHYKSDALQVPSNPHIDYMRTSPFVLDHDDLQTDAETRIDKHPAHKLDGLSFASASDALAAYGVATTTSPGPATARDSRSGGIETEPHDEHIASLRLPPPPELGQYRSHDD